MNIIHRDIKLSNVLLNENMEVRLCDFGLAIDNGMKEQKNICGTLNYIAPELYNKKGGLKYSFKTDIWAFGVLMYSLFYHKISKYLYNNKIIQFRLDNYILKILVLLEI
jgi:serine/threonine protein kinase